MWLSSRTPCRSRAKHLGRQPRKVCCLKASPIDCFRPCFFCFWLCLAFLQAWGQHQTGLLSVILLGCEGMGTRPGFFNRGALRRRIPSAPSRGIHGVLVILRESLVRYIWFKGRHGSSSGGWQRVAESLPNHQAQCSVSKVSLTRNNGKLVCVSLLQLPYLFQVIDW